MNNLENPPEGVPEDDSAGSTGTEKAPPPTRLPDTLEDVSQIRQTSENHPIVVTGT
jgi:hypothetical protein